MVKNGGVCLYKEARLSLEPAYPGSTIAFTLPASSLSTFGSRTTAKRSVIYEQHADHDEEAFTRRHLASDGSMFFRKHHTYPRSFLWRVLDNRNMLEIQSVDLDHSASNRFEANLTLLFHFPSPTRPFCIAFAEPTDRDALTVYAITKSNDLYVLTIHRDFFANPAASEQDIEGWCKRSEPALFSGRIPYRLVAVDVDELLVALDDGAICRLHWDKDTGAWDGSRYQNSNWSVRGLLSWRPQPLVPFDNAELSLSAAAAIALSPDKQHIFSVCLDNTIRAWNVTTGKLGAQVDIMAPDDRAMEKARTSPLHSINPAQPTLMIVIPGPPNGPIGGIGGALYHLLTYSPIQQQFHFWGVRDADDATHGLYDICAESELIPPIDGLMNTTVWTLDEFHVIPGSADWRGTELWVRARSGPTSRIYTLKFDPSDDYETLMRCWKNEWVSVDSGPLTVDGLKSNPGNPSEQDLDIAEGGVDVMQHWLDFLLYPGRFTMATLDTALMILRRGLDQNRNSRSLSRGSLKERMCATVTALAASVQSTVTDATNFEEALATQWQAFYGILKDIHKRRGETLSLAYDRATGMPWLVLSDHLSAIRTCSDAELCTLNAVHLQTSHPSAPLNKALRKPEARDVSRLLGAASSFRQRLPALVQQEVQRQVEMDLLQSRSLTIIDRMESIESQSELLQHVSDEDLLMLVEDLGTEVKDLNSETFLRAIQILGHEDDGRVNSRQQIARYGLKALLRVSQETLQADHNILLDLIVLVLFMFVELEGEMPEDFDPSEVFVELINQYKDCMTVSWMASTVWAHQTRTGTASEILNKTLSESRKNNKRLPFTQTVMEGIYGEKSFDMPLPNVPKTNLLTYWSRSWIALVFQDNYDTVSEDTMGILLGQKEYDLAIEFLKFVPDGNWATYLKGRLHVALGENSLAAVCFQKAAFGLGE